jgi:hypothetical protein
MVRHHSRGFDAVLPHVGPIREFLPKPAEGRLARRSRFSMTANVAFSRGAGLWIRRLPSTILPSSVASPASGSDRSRRGPFRKYEGQRTLRAREEGSHQRPCRLRVRNLHSTNSHKKHLKEMIATDGPRSRGYIRDAKAARTPAFARSVTANSCIT